MDTWSGVTETSGQVSVLIEPREQQDKGLPEEAADSYSNKTP